MKQSTKSLFKDYAAICIGSLLIAIAVQFFMAPSNIVMGSVTGLAVILVNFIPLPLSIMTLILNLIFLVIGFIFFGRSFGGRTVCSALLQPGFLFILEHLFPNFPSLTNDMVLDTVCCSLIVGIGVVMLLNANASSGGLDVLAKVLNKYFHLDVGVGVALIGILTVLCSVFVYDSKTLVVGILGTYFNGLVIDAYVGGFSHRKRVCVFTDEEHDILNYITGSLNRGATLYNVQGAHNRKAHWVIETVLANNECSHLMEHIASNYPDTFVTVSTVNEVHGKWNTPDGQTNL